MTKPTAEPMTPAQALALAALVLDFEAENAAKSRANVWRREVTTAAAILRDLAQNNRSIEAVDGLQYTPEPFIA